MVAVMFRYVYSRPLRLCPSDYVCAVQSVRALKFHCMSATHKSHFIFSVPLLNNLQYYNKIFAIGSNALLPARHCHQSSEETEQTKKALKRLYIPNPLKWLLVKLDIFLLQNQWDPEFDEREFKRGTKQAISVITTLISRNMFNTLEELMTKQAFLALRRDIETSWSDEARRNIELRPKEIQHAIPRGVYFERMRDQKACDIDMLFLALKWTEHKSVGAVISMDIFARFHRNYTDGQIPAWTVSLFQVTHFNVIPFNPSNSV